MRERLTGRPPRDELVGSTNDLLAWQEAHWVGSERLPDDVITNGDTWVTIARIDVPVRLTSDLLVDAHARIDTLGLNTGEGVVMMLVVDGVDRLDTQARWHPVDGAGAETLASETLAITDHYAFAAQGRHEVELRMRITPFMSGAARARANRCVLRVRVQPTMRSNLP